MLNYCLRLYWVKIICLPLKFSQLSPLWLFVSLFWDWLSSHIFSLGFLKGHNMPFSDIFSVSISPGRAASQNIYWKDWIVNSQPQDKWTVPCIPGRESLAESESSRSFSTSDLPTPVNFLTENCTSSRHCPPIVNIMKWFMLSDFVKEATWSRDRLSFKFWVMGEVILPQQLNSDFTVHVS